MKKQNKPEVQLILAPPKYRVSNHQETHSLRPMRLIDQSFVQNKSSLPTAGFKCRGSHEGMRRSVKKNLCVRLF